METHVGTLETFTAPLNNLNSGALPIIRTIIRNNIFYELFVGEGKHLITEHLPFLLPAVMLWDPKIP